MTFCPSGHCLCRTLQEQSTRVWNDLEDADRYQTPRYEETISQDLCLHLNKSHPDTSRTQLLAKKAEKKSGADFLWLVYDDVATECILLAVQAKRIYPSGRYEAFEQAQARTLLQWASQARALPIYLLFNYHRVRPSIYDYWHNFRARYPIDYFDHPRDLGLLAYRAEGLESVSDGKLAPNFPPKHSRIPLWLPFCTCLGSDFGSRIEEFALRFAINVTADEVEDAYDAVPTRKIPEIILDWLKGATLSNNQILQALEIPEPSAESFRPSFLQAMRLGQRGERPD